MKKRELEDKPTVVDIHEKKNRTSNVGAGEQSAHQAAEEEWNLLSSLPDLALAHLLAFLAGGRPSCTTPFPLSLSLILT
jgi:hypothetical protein